MATTIPVPVEFELPDGWTPAPPDEVGAPGAAFVALRPPAENGFTANITISGDYPAAEATLEVIADESVQRLEQSSEQVTVTNRTEVGTAEAPGLTQLVRMRPIVEGSALDLVQSQVYISLLDVDNPQQRFVLQLVLTATPGQLDGVIDDFQQFVSTVRPKNADTGSEEGEG